MDNRQQVNRVVWSLLRYVHVRKQKQLCEKPCTLYAYQLTTLDTVVENIYDLQTTSTSNYTNRIGKHHVK